MHALQVLGALAVVAAFASCAFDDGSLRWAVVALVACVVGTIIEFALGAWPLGLATGALSVVAGRRAWRRLNPSRADKQAPADKYSSRDPHPRA